MTDQTSSREFDESERCVIQTANRYYQEVTVSKVTGGCPYGHKEGDRFTITSMNSDGMCGALLKSIFFQIVMLPAHPGYISFAFHRAGSAGHPGY